MRHIFSLLLIFLPTITCQSINFLLIVEKIQQKTVAHFSDGFKWLEKSVPGVVVRQSVLNFQKNTSEDSFKEMCSLLNQMGHVSAVVDSTWGGWTKGRKSALKMGLPYIRLMSAELTPFVVGADDFLMSKRANDAALIFEDKSSLDQGLGYIIGNSFLRIVATNMNEANILDRLKKMRPRPSNFVVWGQSKVVNNFYKAAKAKQLVTRDIRWTLIFTDFSEPTFDYKELEQGANLILLNDDNCCIISGGKEGEANCNCTTMTREQLSKITVESGGRLISESIYQMIRNGETANLRYQCDTKADETRKQNKGEPFKGHQQKLGDK